MSHHFSQNKHHTPPTNLSPKNSTPLLNHPIDNTDQTLKTMYSVACVANLIINLDHGILPACTQEIMQDVNIDEFGLGLLGSVVYVGLLLGSITSGPLLQNYSSKKVITLSTLGNFISLFIFPMTQSFGLLCLSRAFVGFFQVFLVIYFPVWVDTHGKENKTLWITFLQLGVPLGVFFGYALTGVFVKYLTWRASFYAQIVLLTPCLIAFFFFDENLMSTSHVAGTSRRGSAQKAQQENFLLTISYNGSFFENEIRDYVLGNENPGQKEDHIPIDLDDELTGERLGYFDYIRILWNKKVYIYTMLAISALYFVITGIQFWISDYMRTVLKQPKEAVFMAFGLISITGPTLGVIVGGIVLDRLGGYTGKGALDFCLIFGVLASLFAIPVPFFNDFKLICGLLWFLLFFGGAIMPAVVGIMLSSIPKRMRAMGYSTAQIVQNFLGYVPAPVVYGFVVDITGGDESRFGMILLMSWTTIGVFSLYAAKNARIQKHVDYMKQQNVDIDNEEAQKPDLFEPKPKVIELKQLALPDDEYEEDEYDAEGIMRTRNRRRTLIESFSDVSTSFRRKSINMSPKGKLQRELEALNQATVDPRTLRTPKTGLFLSKENLNSLGMVFGRVTRDKQRMDIADEML